MTKAEEIAGFLEQNIDWERDIHQRAQWSGDNRWLVDPTFVRQARPTVEDLAQYFLAKPEYRALKLGTWLGTTDGQVVAQAVEMFVPPFYREDVELLVKALQLAASIQEKQGSQVAGLVALAAVVGFVVLVSMTARSQPV